jgi:hypothetical protein
VLAPVDVDAEVPELQAASARTDATATAVALANFLFIG